MLEKMTNIMTHQQNVPLASAGGPGGSKRLQGSTTNMMMNSVDQFNSQQRSKSLNKNVRQKEIARITEENEGLLRRLQEKTSHYNVFDWELDRKKQIKMLKKICYYPPTMIKKRHKSKRRKELDPNSEVYQFYQ